MAYSYKRRKSTLGRRGAKRGFKKKSPMYRTP